MGLTARALRATLAAALAAASLLSTERRPRRRMDRRPSDSCSSRRGPGPVHVPGRRGEPDAAKLHGKLATNFPCAPDNVAFKNIA